MEIAEEYVQLVCGELRLSVEAVKSKCRKRELTEARQLIAYFLGMYTNLTLWRIAEALNHKSHANALHGKKQVAFFFENDRDFKHKYNFLLPLAEDLSVKIKNGTLNSRVLKPGNICWFWNEKMALPILEIFKSFQVDYQNRIWFRTIDENKPDYPFCRYAGSMVFPAEFKRPLKADVKEENQDSEIFYEDSLIAPICESSTARELKELCTT